jgi:Ca-activated chloride channel homolog
MMQGGSMTYTIKLFVMLSIMSAALFADGFVIFPPPQLTPLSVKYHKVTCTVDNGVASTAIDQLFVNNQADAFTGGKYVFPVPKGALIDQFKVIIDGEAKTATVMSKDTARAFFNEAVKNSTQASLLEYTDNSAYTVEIGAVAPGAARRIQISYVEVLPKTNGLSRYLYPLNTGKFSMQLIDTVSIVVKISNTTPITSVYAPSFPVTLDRIDERTVVATYISVKSRPDRDFDLYYKLSEDDLSFHLFTYKKTYYDGYFLMLITPKPVKPQEGQEVVAKDIVFTIDRSGSMAGTKIVQARDALRFCVNRLLTGDYFNIVAFDNAIISNADQLLPASSENVQKALSFVETVTSNGSTDIATALTTSLARIGSSDRPHYCIFLTDGQPTTGVTDIGKISSIVNAANTSGTRIFSVGFGFDVNTVLIDKLSIDNGGFPLYCSPSQNIDEVISDLYKRIESPIMTSPALTIDTMVATYGVSPSKLTDLFSGSEIAVFGRYKGAGIGTVTLCGNTGEKIDTLRFEAEFPLYGIEYSFLPRLWATQQISRLLTKIKLQTLTNEDIVPLKDSVIALSKEYGIVTPYTSSVFVSGGATSWAADLQVASGGKANDASNFMQGMQQNSNAAQTVVADTNAVSYTIAPQLNQMQNAGNKLFVYKNDNVWYDATFDSTAASDTVYYGTDAYFALAAGDAELRDFLAVGNQTAFNFNGQNYLVLDKTTPVTVPLQPRVPGSDIALNFMVRQHGTAMQFARSNSTDDAVIDVYAINGSRVASMPFKKQTTSLVVDLSRGMKITNGAYIAVYRSVREKIILKFVTRR